MEQGTEKNPWKLRTLSGDSEYSMYRDYIKGKEIIVCVNGNTILQYDYNCLLDLHTLLKEKGDWIELGSVDEYTEVRENTIEAWARSEKNPIGGWYGLKQGFRGNFGAYIAPLMVELGLAEITDNQNENKIRSLQSTVEY